jgi:hypothetical protein
MILRSGERFSPPRTVGIQGEIKIKPILVCTSLPLTISVDMPSIQSSQESAVYPLLKMELTSFPSVKVFDRPRDYQRCNVNGDNVQKYRSKLFG